MQSLLRLAFPPQCISCGQLVELEFGLCGSCWRETPFITGLTCDLCGVPLIGEDQNAVEHCDDCRTIARPWERGRAAVLYKDTARKLILALKHGDRLELARPLAGWMAGVADPVLLPDSVVVPIPIHRWRLLKRRYNQAGLLAQALAKKTGHKMIPDLLNRVRATPILDGKTRVERFIQLSDAIKPERGAIDRLGGRPVLLVDDVMTSGATMAAATEACYAAGASQVNILVLARVAKDT